MKFFCACDDDNAGLCDITTRGEGEESGGDAVKKVNTCMIGLGPCSIEHCNEDCCKNKCNYHFSALNPAGFCDTYPGNPGRVCLCQHDC